MLNSLYKTTVSVLIFTGVFLFVVTDVSGEKRLNDSREIPDSVVLQQYKMKAEVLRTVNIDSAAELLNKGILYFANRKDTKAQAELYLELAALHNSTGSLKLAQIAGEESLRLFTQCGY